MSVAGASWIPDRIIENSPKSIKSRHGIRPTAMSWPCFTRIGTFCLNDICDSLHNHAGPLAQIRNCTPPSRNGLSHANKTRNADMAEELFWKVYESLSTRYPEFLTSSRNYPGLPYRFRTRTIRAVDSTTIKLTAFNMGWAQHRRQKAAAKMHTALNMRSFLPNFVIVKSAKDSDPKSAWELCADMKAGEIVVFDKAYVDFKHLKVLDARGVSWVTRAKDNMLYEVMGQHATGKREPSRRTGAILLNPRRRRCSYGTAAACNANMSKKCKVLSDERIRLIGVQTKDNYPDDLRLVTAEVEVKGKMVVMTFITNNFEWSPFSVCQLYQCRWGVEVFFKEIKQTLQLADFLGYNENAVRWQVWTALLAYLLLRFVAWYNKWKRQFSRLFTLLRAVLWNYFSLPSIIECCDTKRERRHIIRGSPEKAYQLYFEGMV